MLRLFTLALLGLVSTAAVVTAGDHCFVQSAPIVVRGYSQPRPIVIDQRPVFVQNGGGRRFVNGGGGGPVVRIIDAVGRLANSQAGSFVLGALAGGGTFRR